MVGKYSDDPAERQSAIARGLFLDKESERLHAIAESERNAAVATHGGVNPFKANTATEAEKGEAI